jgi:hypothetical protein
MREGTRQDPFEATGHPLHTRTLLIDVREEAGHRLGVRGAILDLRKCGFVPTGGDLQTAGLIHHMTLAGSVDRESRRLERLDAAQPVVAFEASARTAGESCRDPIGRLAGLAGERLDDAFVRKLGARFGGALGCSHLLTLGQLLAATLPGVLDREADAGFGTRLPREPGELVFRRTLVLDGFERGEAEMALAIQLTDVHTAPSPGAQRPLERFAAQHEVRVLARVEEATMRLRDLDAAERQRSRETLTTAPWRSRRDDLAPFVGEGALAGLARSLLARFAGHPADRPLLDALLNLAPGLIQCMAALSNRLVEHMAGRRLVEAAAISRTFGVGGQPDSCYMWRRGGPMEATRTAAVAPHDEA